MTQSSHTSLSALCVNSGVTAVRSLLANRTSRQATEPQSSFLTGGLMCLRINLINHVNRMSGYTTWILYQICYGIRDLPCSHFFFYSGANKKKGDPGHLQTQSKCVHAKNK